MFIACTQPNTKCSSLVQLHSYKDLILSSQSNSNILNPKDLWFKFVLQYLKGKIFHRRAKFLHRSSCLQTLSYLSLPKKSWRVTASMRTAEQKGSSCPLFKLTSHQEGLSSVLPRAWAQLWDFSLFVDLRWVWKWPELFWITTAWTSKVA